jgi:hypothetical protein
VTGRPTLAEARARLRELGYLDGGVDRLLFRPVFEGRGGAFLPAVLIGALAAALAALAAVEVSEPGFGASLRSTLALATHLFLANLAPAAILALALGGLAARVRAPGIVARAAGLASALSIFALWIAGTYSLAPELAARSLLWGIPLAVAAFFLAAAVRRRFWPARSRARDAAAPGQPPRFPRRRARASRRDPAPPRSRRRAV